MILSKSKVALLVIAVLVMAYVINCTGTSLTIYEVADRHTFTVKETKFQIAIDGPAILHVRGKLDGKAALFGVDGSKEDSRGLPIWNGIWGPNPRLLKLAAGEIDTVWIYSTRGKDIRLVYQPLTVKNGWLSIKVDY